VCVVLCRGGKKNWRDAYVNGTPFTIACMAFAAIVFGAVITTAAMIVAGEEDDERNLTSSASNTFSLLVVWPDGHHPLWLTMKIITSRGCQRGPRAGAG